MTMENPSQENLFDNTEKTETEPIGEPNISPEEDPEYAFLWDKAFENVERFETMKENHDYGSLEKEWENKFEKDPVSFFDEENLKLLREIPAEERLMSLSHASGFLRVTPSMVDRYFRFFPEDLEAVKVIFRSCNGMPSDGYDYNLFAISANSLSRGEEKMEERYRSMAQFREICDRREMAPRFILNGTQERYNDSFGKFGLAADGFGNALDEAGELARSGKYYIDAGQIFTLEYEAMSLKDKAEFLRRCVDTLHFDLLFEETFNSCFTRERVKSDKNRLLERSAEGLKSHNNVAHSMIFKTFQPLSAYDADQGIYDHEMNHTHWGGGDIEEYPYHRLLLAVLGELGNMEVDKEENIDKIVDFWNKNRNPIFANAVADILSKQGPERAATKLLDILRNEDEDKNAISGILYRLEFGRMNMSEDGIKYLGKMYDLKEYNDPGYHVSRLTPEGQIGIFNSKDNNKLEGYFDIDLESDLSRIEAEVRNFVYDTLFFPKENETEEERRQREKYLEEYKENYYAIASREAFGKGNMRLNNLSFREQGWFMTYYNNAKPEEAERLDEFIERFGEEGARTFMALESGEDLGNTVLEIAEKSYPNESVAIFCKFNEISRNLKNSGEELEKIFRGSRNISEAEMAKIQQGILKKGAKLLAEYAARIRKIYPDRRIEIEKKKALIPYAIFSGTFNKTEYERDEKKSLEYHETVMRDLSSYNADLILTASVFKAMDKGSVKLEDLQGVSLESMTADKLVSREIRSAISSIIAEGESEISSEKIRELAHDFTDEKDRETIEAVSRMVEMYEKNYESRPRFKETLIRDFLEVLAENGDKTLFYFLKKDGNINAFCRFDELPNGKKYAGSLNVDSTIHDFSIGSCFFLECFNKESKNSDIVAACDAFAPMSSVHIEKEGFAVKEMIAEYNQEDKKEHRVTAFSIEKERGKNYHYSGKNKEELVEEYANIQDEAKYFSGDCFVMKFPADSMDREAVSEKLINDEKYVMTRFFYYGSNNEEIYCAFEKGGN